jgi:hypothetical protein
MPGTKRKVEETLTKEEFKVKVQGIVSLLNEITSSIEIVSKDTYYLPGFGDWELKRLSNLIRHPYYRCVEFMKGELVDYTNKVKEAVIDMYEETYEEALECE